MGDPIKARKKYSKPFQMWQKERIDAEKILIKEYGLKNKKEIWKMEAVLRNFTRQAKKLIATKTAQTEKEKEQLMKKLSKLGLLTAGAELSEVLGLTVKDITNRRLQTIVFKKELARNIKQSRQFITHGHVTIAGKKVTVPSYLVAVSEEANIAFSNKSALADETHPERTKDTDKPEEKKEK
ncbi:MAG: 30S ribosomal protein S4 [bacterium]|nr:30S ribosomal protein S4 [bacterium]